VGGGEDVAETTMWSPPLTIRSTLHASHAAQPSRRGRPLSCIQLIPLNLSSPLREASGERHLVRVQDVEPEEQGAA